jgi:hypothetical protein
MDALFGQLRRALGADTYLAYNGLFNFEPGQLEDQIRLLDNTNAAAIEYFGLDPNEREHTFSKDIQPYLKARDLIPDNKAVLTFGRAPWRYTDYLEDYRWQRYLFASFLLAARDNDLFKYHASFQVPAHEGRAGGLDHYAEWRLQFGKAKGPATFSGGLYRREFDEARVLVAPDDGNGGSITLRRAFYTPEGRSVEGEVTLAPGTGMVLLHKANLALVRPQSKVISANDMGAWKWSRAALSGGPRPTLELQAVPDEMTGEHDVLLDGERSLMPYQRLTINATAKSNGASILAVAEVDDPKKEHDMVIVEVTAVGATRAMRLDEPIPFRSTLPRRSQAQWPVLTVARSAAPGPIVLDAPTLFDGSGYRFRRWSHIRFVGDVSVVEIALSQAQEPAILEGQR